MKKVLFFLVCSLICFLAGCYSAREEFIPPTNLPPPKPLFPDDPKGTNLPAGVSRMIDTNGNVISLDHEFTTPQYRRAVAQWLLQEANRVAEQMRFPNEALPITKSNLTVLFIPPFGFSCIFKSVGVAGTSNFVYMCSKENRFCGLAVADYDQVCLKLAELSLPVAQMDTNAAYVLATQWLAAASMDVNRLNRECRVEVGVSAYWNGLDRFGQVPKKNFVPIYGVYWMSPQNDADAFGDVASVELFLPTKQLLQLSAHDPKYNLNKPFVITNPASLFPGTGRVTVLPKMSDPGGFDPNSSRPRAPAVPRKK
jgi:hypothetical protein